MVGVLRQLKKNLTQESLKVQETLAMEQIKNNGCKKIGRFKIREQEIRLGEKGTGHLSFPFL